ncbi:hypothetical protein ABT285_29520 [Streptomyces microflavus]
MAEELEACSPVHLACDTRGFGVDAFGRDAAAEGKRSAIVTLAGILEERRALLKDQLGKDEEALFEYDSVAAEKPMATTQPAPRRGSADDRVSLGDRSPSGRVVLGAQRSAHSPQSASDGLS